MGFTSDDWYIMGMAGAIGFAAVVFAGFVLMLVHRACWPASAAHAAEEPSSDHTISITRTSIVDEEV